mmetsp:Transcript_40626/g.67211  ORF Transcript_40626/g.67211 Transcript_40626/m.67211 type:complete len:147 (+) Transcript_40626:28-468(+)
MPFSCWQIAAHMLPIPLAFLIFISVPLPQQFASKIQTLSVQMISKLRVPLFITIWGIWLCLMGLIAWYKRSIKKFYGKEGYELRYQESKEASFRAERNFWLVSFGLILWITLYNMHRLVLRNLNLQHQIKASQNDIRAMQRTAGRE